MQWLKFLHVLCVILSASGFFIRGVWMFNNASRLQQSWVKIMPHVIDTLLLISALLMWWGLQWSLFEHQWLQVKIIALLVYILLGMFALNSAYSMKLRIIAWLSGLFVFAYIVSIAITKNPMGFMFM